MPLKKPLLIIVLVIFSNTLWSVDFGQRDTQNEWESVVALAKLDEQDHGRYRIFCSGVVISKRFILTAAHCLQEGAQRPGRSKLRNIARETFIYFGQGKEGGLIDDDKDLLSVENIWIHPSYLRDIRGQADIALIELSDPAPLHSNQIVPMALDLELLRSEVRRGATLTAVGYGYSQQWDENSLLGFSDEIFGVKHSGQIQIQGKTADEILTIPGDAIDSFGLYRPAPRSGDSGGAAFYQRKDGSLYLAGIISRAARHNYGQSGVALSSVRNWVCWIKRHSNERFHNDYMGPNYCDQVQRVYRDRELQELDFIRMCQDSKKSGDTSRAYTFYVLKTLLNARGCQDLEIKLQEMTNLNLDATHIVDLSPLSFFSNLERLSLRDNSIVSVLPLKDILKLRFLDISYNNVRDLESLVHLEEQGTWIVGGKRQYFNIARNNFIRMCRDPKVVGQARRTINALMDQFGIERNECVNANYELIRLRNLELYQSRGLVDMSVLGGLHTLEGLNLSNHSISDLSFLEDIESLRRLDLSGNNFSEDQLKYILQHQNLRELSLNNVEIQDISILAKLPRLRVLNLRGTSVDDLSAFYGRLERGVIEINL